MNCHQWYGTVLCAILVLSTSSAVALGQTAPATDGVMGGNGEGLAPAPTEAAADPVLGAELGDAGFGPPCSPRWTASADFILFDRVGGVNQALVSTYPPHSPLVLGTGTERLNSSDFNQGYSGGPRLDLIRHGDCGYDLELSYFQIDGWNSSKSVGPDGGQLPNWLVFAAPGDFVQTTDYPDQAMAWSYATRLYNAELNVRWELCSRVTMLAGFRWVNLLEDLQGTLPPERAAPFWDTKTRNDLYGIQIGEEWKVLNYGRFSLDGLVKAGIFDNSAGEKTAVSIYRVMYDESASTNQAAFLGEIALRCKYQLTERLSLKAGYEAIWLQGVALAPAQIPQTLSHGTPPTDVYVQALGTDSGSGVFFHGATVGLEYAF